MNKQQIEFLTSWMEWGIESQYETLNMCTSCDGTGDHGVEEETGCFYTCYACAGTGNYHTINLGN